MWGIREEMHWSVACDHSGVVSERRSELRLYGFGSPLIRMAFFFLFFDVACLRFLPFPLVRGVAG